MSTVRFQKLWIFLGSIAAGLFALHVAVQFRNTIASIAERHPDMGVLGWSLAIAWVLAGAGIAAYIDWLCRKRGWAAGQGNVALIFISAYLLISALFYLFR